jgi:hypothetical protein
MAMVGVLQAVSSRQIGWALLLALSCAPAYMLYKDEVEQLGNGYRVFAPVGRAT